MSEDRGKAVTVFRSVTDARACPIGNAEGSNPNPNESEVNLTLISVEVKPSVAGSLVEAPSEIVTLGSHVLLEDLDDATQEEYTLVLSPESNPGEGRLSNESPVGRAIVGHHEGEVVDALAPARERRLRIASVS